MIRKLCALVFVFAFSAHAFSSAPPPPATLWDLTRSASHVVFARIESVDRNREDLMLTVKQTWVGQPLSRVTLHIARGFACEGPADFRAGEDAVVFLSMHTREAIDVRYVSGEEGARAIRELVLLALEMQKRASNSKDAPLEWIVEALKRAATRTDGANALHQVDPSARTRMQHYEANGLSGVMMVNLSEAFMKTPVSDVTLISVMRLLRTFSSERLTAAFADAMETLLSSAPTPAWSFEALEEFQQRFPSERFEPGLTALDSWDAMKSQLKLSPRLIGRGAPTPLLREVDDDLFSPEPPLAKKRPSSR